MCWLRANTFVFPNCLVSFPCRRATCAMLFSRLVRRAGATSPKFCRCFLEFIVSSSGVLPGAVDGGERENNR
jgi:hypothetical protein